MSESSVGLILVGGGGFALELFSYITDEIENGSLSNLVIKGVLDNLPDCELCTKHSEVEYLGNISDYIPTLNNFGLIAVNNASRRRDIADQLQKVDLPLYSYVHSSAYVASNAKLGKGVIVGPHCIVSAHSDIGDNVAMNVFCGVGHSAKIGSHSVMSPYSVVNGDCELGESVFLGSRVTLNQQTKIGDFALIDSGSIIRQDIVSFSLVSQRVEQKIIDNRILRRQIFDQ